MSRAARLGALWSGGKIPSMPITNLAVGSKIKFGQYSVNGEIAEPVIWRLIVKNHTGYPSGAYTFIADKIIDLRPVDAREPNNPAGNRRNLGNNYYKATNINQWLNKNAAAGEWYEAQHSYDQASTATYTYSNTYYDNRPAFLNGFTDKEKSAILSTTIRTARSSMDGGGYEDFTCKVFLPSRTEMGLGDEVSGTPEGTSWGYFTTNSSRVSYLTAQAFNNTLSSPKPSTAGTAWRYNLRTPRLATASDLSSLIYVDADGSYNSSGMGCAYGNTGIRPAMNLPSTLMVTETIDEDGCYIIVF